MEYFARIDLTEEYFRESFEQWLNHKSKFRRWQIQIGILLIVVGVGMMIYELTVFSIGVSIIGIIEIVEFLFYRRRWIHQRVHARSKNSDSPVELRADDSGIYQKGPTSEGTTSWRGVKAAIPTGKGLIIAIGDGMSVYVPDACMNNPEFKEFVIKKVGGDP